MNKIKNFTAASLAAVLVFGCTNNQPDAHAEHHREVPQIPVDPDTAEISEKQKVFFVNLKDGDVVKSPVTVKFGVEGMRLMPVDSGARPNWGHHHLLIDTIPFVAAGEMVPMGFNNILHFGKGQTEASLNLNPGIHHISLQFADPHHRSYGIRMSRRIKIIVNQGLPW